MSPRAGPAAEARSESQSRREAGSPSSRRAPRETRPLFKALDLLGEMLQQELRLDVHLEVVLRPQPVTGLQAVLTHHDHRGLQSGNARKHQVEKDERIGIPVMDGGLRRSAPSRAASKIRNETDEAPAADGAGQRVGHAIAQGAPLFLQDVDVGRRAVEKKLAHLRLQVAEPLCQLRGLPSSAPSPPRASSFLHHLFLFSVTTLPSPPVRNSDRERVLS